MKVNPRILIHSVCVIALLLLQTWHFNKSIPTGPIDINSDAKQYMQMAYHIYHHHTISNLKVAVNPRPTSRREPIYPLYMAGMMKFFPKFKSVEFSVLTDPKGGLQLFRYCQIPVLLTMSLCAWILAYLITKKYLLSYLSMFVVGYGHILLMIAFVLKREHFMATVVMIVAIFLFLAVKHKRKLYFLLLGLSLSLLVLTNAIFEYMIYVLVIYFLWLLKKRVFEKKQCVILLGIMLVSFFIPTTAWKIRNYIHFKRFFICDGASAVLSIRAEYNKMTADEFLGAFYFWTPDPIFQEKAAREMKKGRWVKLHRSNPNGYYYTGKKFLNLKKENDEYSSPAEKDKLFQGRAIKEILKHPFRHIIVTIPFAWRGIFAEFGYVVSAPFSLLFRSIFLVNILYFASLFYWFVRSFRKQDWPLFTVTLMCMYLYGMNAFFSHSLPRYNQPLIPVLAILFVLAASRIFTPSDPKEKISKS